MNDAPFTNVVHTAPEKTKVVLSIGSAEVACYEVGPGSTPCVYFGAQTCWPQCHPQHPVTYYTEPNTATLFDRVTGDDAEPPAFSFVYRTSYPWHDAAEIVVDGHDSVTVRRSAFDTGMFAWRPAGAGK
jgi:hypothetical protein